MTNRVFTYFEPLFEETKEQEKELVRAWEQNWRAAGWYPIVLRMADSASNPLYSKFSEAIYALPTVNNKRYEMACWQRWLAFSAASKVYGPSLFIDYDIAATTALKRPESPCWLGLGLDTSCFADHHMLDKIINLMMTRASEGIIEIDGRPHVSDMTLLNKLGHEIAPNLGICSLYPSTNQLVHINNSSVIAHGKGRNRLSIFKEVAAQLKP